jgi:uncharacterized protein (DUF4415 family)
MIEIVWDEPKRQANLVKHGLDFASVPFEFFLTARIATAKAGPLSGAGPAGRKAGRRDFQAPRQRGVFSDQPAPGERGGKDRTMTASVRKTRTSYGKADMKAVSDNPPWTKATTARAKSFDEAFPDIARRARGPQKAPTKKQITLRLDARVVAHFKATGEGWQRRINEALKKAAGI